MNPFKAKDLILKTLQAMFDSVSFTRDQKPDWERLRNLFTSGSSITHLEPGRVKTMDLEHMMAEFKEQIDTGVVIEHQERLVSHRIQCYGHTAHAWCVYQAQSKTGKGESSWQGIHNIQLIFEQNHWKIINLVWQDENPLFSIPPSLA